MPKPATVCPSRIRKSPLGGRLRRLRRRLWRSGGWHRWAHPSANDRRTGKGDSILPGGNQNPTPWRLGEKNTEWRKGPVYILSLKSRSKWRQEPSFRTSVDKWGRSVNGGGQAIGQFFVFPTTQLFALQIGRKRKLVLCRYHHHTSCVSFMLTLSFHFPHFSHK